MLWAGAGGFVGTCLRFLVGRYMHHIAPAAIFPWGTLTVNLLGSLLIGFLYGLLERSQLLTPTASALLITGLCGGFTTFSSFTDDGLRLLEGNHYILFIFYLTLSLCLGFLMVYWGREIIRG